MESDLSESEDEESLPTMEDLKKWTVKTLKA